MKSEFAVSGAEEGYFAFQWSSEAAEFLRHNRFLAVTFSGNWGDFSFISEFAEFIQSLDLENTDRDASGVGALSGLKDLRIRGKLKRPPDLSKLKSLERCTIAWHKSYANTVFSLPLLKELTIEYFSESSFDSVKLRGSMVEKLTLLKPSNESMSGISALKYLHDLDIELAIKVRDATELGELRGLRRLRILNAKMIRDFPSLTKLGSLEVLILSNVGGLTNIDFIYALQNITTMSIGGEAVSVDWGSILRLPKLKTLQILVDKEECPSADRFNDLLAGAKRRAADLKVISPPRSHWASVQLKLM